MKYQEFIKRVAENASISQSDAKKTVKAAFETLTDAMKSGDEVKIPIFGTFKVVHVEAKKGRNPQNGEEILIEAKNKPVFKASVTLKDAVK